MGRDITVMYQAPAHGGRSERCLPDADLLCTGARVGLEFDGSERARRSGMVVLFEVDDVSITASAVGDTARGIDFDVSLEEQALNVRKGTKTVVSLHQKGVLRTSRFPSGLPGELNESIAAVREDG